MDRFTQKSYLKHVFFKNKTDLGGAMHFVISSLKQSEIAMHTHTLKNGKSWAITTPNALLKFTEVNRGAFEIISSFPHKVYFDIDKKDEAGEYFLTDIKAQILAYFPTAKFAILEVLQTLKPHIILF